MKNRGSTDDYKTRLARKRKEANARNKAWSTLSPTEQLSRLDARLGKGQGAKRQRERIQAQIEQDSDKE